MATTTKKTNTKPKVEVEEVVETEPKVEVPEPEPVKEKKVFDRDTEIPCKSVTIGGLWLDGIKTNRIYRWVNYGDIEYVEYQDLASMVPSENNNYIYGPLIVIQDDDFVEQFPHLKTFYEEKYKTKDLYEILALETKEMVKAIDVLPKMARENLKRLISTQVSNGSLDSVSKIKALDEIFGTELGLVQSLTKK